MRSAAAAGDGIRSWALAVTAEGFDGVVVTGHGSPLLVGEGDNTFMAGSDVLGFEPGIQIIRELSDGDIVSISSRVLGLGCGPDKVVYGASRRWLSVGNGDVCCTWPPQRRRVDDVESTA